MLYSKRHYEDAVKIYQDSHPGMIPDRNTIQTIAKPFMLDRKDFDLRRFIAAFAPHDYNPREHEGSHLRFLAELHEHHACNGATWWVNTFRLDLEAAWWHCPRGDWMLWLLPESSRAPVCLDPEFHSAIVTRPCLFSDEYLYRTAEFIRQVRNVPKGVRR